MSSLFSVMLLLYNYETQRIYAKLYYYLAAEHGEGVTVGVSRGWSFLQVRDGF